MKKIIPLIFSVLYALNSNAQAVGGWGTCEFTDVVTMNAFDPSTNAYDCKKVFVQATNEHYYWNGTAWVLVQDTDTDDQTLSLSSNTLSISEGNSVNLSGYLDNTDDQTASEVNITDTGGNFTSTNVEGALAELATATDENIYNTDGTLTGDRELTFGGNDLTMKGTSDVVFKSDGKIGLGINLPLSPLHINANGTGTNGIIKVEGTEPDILFNDTDGGFTTFTFQNAGTSQVAFGKNNANDFYITRNASGWQNNSFVLQRSTGNVGIGTSSPNSKLTLGSDILHDAAFNYSDAQMTIFDANNNGGNSPAAARDILHLVREGVNGEAYGNKASFALSRYENNSTNSRTQLDIKLTEGSFNAHNNIMSLRSNGRVGIGTTTPAAQFDVDGGTVKFSDYGTGTNTGTQTFLLAVDADGDVIETPLVTNTDDQTASEVNITDAGGNFTSTNVEGALTELANATDENIYNTDGTLTTNRAVTTGNFDLNIDVNTLVVDGSANRVGIGLNDPSRALSLSAGNSISLNGGNVSTNNTDGLFWHNALNYGIYRSSGGWTSPDYQQLTLDWPTGIVLNPGTLFGKSFVDVQGDGLKTTKFTMSNGAANGYLLQSDGSGNASWVDPTAFTNTDDQTASEVNITDAGGNFTSTNVEGALTELANADDDNIYNTDGALGEDREVTLDGNSLTFKGSSDVIIQADGDVGIGTAGPSGRLHATNTTDRNGFMFESSNGLTGEKDVFTIQDNDTGGGGQDHSSVLKVHKNAPINNSDEGFSLIELANTGTNPNGNEYWISGRKSDEGAPEWGVQISDNQIWSSGGILLNATGAANGTYSGGDFIVESGGDVGIGTISPDAKLDVEGGTVRFSDYGAGTNSGTATRLLAVDADGDVIETPLVTNTDAQNLGLVGTNLSITGGNTVNLSGLADNLGNHTATTDLNMSTHDIDFTTGEANFGTNVRQMVNLYSTSYGIGVQSNTQYYRTGNHFAWYRGGSHNGSALNNGGGTTMMVLNDSGNLGLGGINPSYKFQVFEGNNTSASITTNSEAGDATLFLGTAFSGSAGAQKTAIIAEGSGGWSRAKLHFALEGSTGDNSSAANADISDSKMTIQYDGNVGIGTTTPDAKLDVEGGSVRFTDYGSGTYDNTSTATHILGIEADGDVVEMNTAKSSRIFYPPAIAIVADAIVVDETLDLHQTYIDLFDGSATSFIKSTTAPGAIPTYAQDELYYYILDYDPAVFANVTIDDNGLMEYDVIAPASGNCSFINIVFVVK